MSKTIYLAGPMRGYPEFNFPAFAKAAEDLRTEGHTVFSPAEKDQEKHGKDFGKTNKEGDIDVAIKDGFSLRDALKDDLSWICDHADTIALLPGWEQSAGARTEHALAVTLDIDIVYIGG